MFWASAKQNVQMILTAPSMKYALGLHRLATTLVGTAPRATSVTYRHRDIAPNHAWAMQLVTQGNIVPTLIAKLVAVEILIVRYLALASSVSSADVR